MTRLTFHPFDKTVIGIGFFHCVLSRKKPDCLSFDTPIAGVSAIYPQCLDPLIYAYKNIQILHFTIIYYLEYIYKQMPHLTYYLVTEWHSL